MKHALGASVRTAVQSRCGLGQGQSKDPGPRPGRAVRWELLQMRTLRVREAPWPRVAQAASPLSPWLEDWLGRRWPLPPAAPQPRAWARRHCQALTQPPAQHPRASPAQAEGSRGTKVQSVPARAPTPLPAPGTKGPRPQGARQQQQPPPLCPSLRPGVPQF